LWEAKLFPSSLEGIDEDLLMSLQNAHDIDMKIGVISWQERMKKNCS